ncbi:MAG: hypothetical protein HOI95_28455, partial [Chromatiales bacterium]|nr:hypothetical protein [Chromatiales bacterium]
DTWSDVLASLQVGGLTRELGANCQLVDASEEQALLRLSEAHSQLNSPRARAALSEALNIYAGHPLQLTIETGVRTGESPAERRSREAQERRAEATETIRRDPQVAAICDMFGAVVDPDAVVPADEPGAA